MTRALAVSGARARGGALSLVVVLAASCGASTLLAPSGTTLTVSSTATALSFDGSATITARLLVAGGAPPDGTMVTFATTLGSVQPSQVPTAGGVATAVLTAGAVSGTTVVTASSGTATGPGVNIAIGLAAVAKVVVAASAPLVPFGGGATAITASVVDAGGNPLATIPVSFVTTAGSLTSSVVKTDVKGVAQVTLSTSQPALVTATAAPSSADTGGGAVPTVSGTVTVSVGARPQPVVAIAAAGTPVAQASTTFTVAATPAPGSNTTIQNVTVSFGDGGRADLGAVTGTAIVAQHVYATGGPYTASVTAVDSGGGTATASTVVAVGFAVPVSVVVTAAAPVVTPTGSIVTLTAAVSPATAVVSQYLWNFGDGTAPRATTANQVQNIFVVGTKTYMVTVTVTLAGGGTATGTAIIFVP